MKFTLDCPKCGNELIIVGYSDDNWRFEGECRECEKIYDIRLKEI